MESSISGEEERAVVVAVASASCAPILHDAPDLAAVGAAAATPEGARAQTPVFAAAADDAGTIADSGAVALAHGGVGVGPCARAKRGAARIPEQVSLP